MQGIARAAVAAGTGFLAPGPGLRRQLPDANSPRSAARYARTSGSDRSARLPAGRSFLIASGGTQYLVARKGSKGGHTRRDGAG